LIINCFTLLCGLGFPQPHPPPPLTPGGVGLGGCVVCGWAFQLFVDWWVFSFPLPSPGYLWPGGLFAPFLYLTPWAFLAFAFFFFFFAGVLFMVWFGGGGFWLVGLGWGGGFCFFFLWAIPNFLLIPPPSTSPGLSTPTPTPPQKRVKKKTQPIVHLSLHFLPSSNGVFRFCLGFFHIGVWSTLVFLSLRHKKHLLKLNL